MKRFLLLGLSYAATIAGVFILFEIARAHFPL